MLPSFKKTDIAVEYLKNAIRLYREGSSYFTCLHLAGAAEEILGKAIEHSEKTYTPEQRTRSALGIAIDTECEVEKIISGRIPKRKDVRTRLLYAKNSIKHFTDLSEEAVCIDPRIEAREMLLNAIYNYSCIFIGEEDSVIEFEQELFYEEESEITAFVNSTPKP